MSKQQLIQENIKLSQKFVNFLIEHPEALEKFQDNSSYVFFSADNTELNESNLKLAESLLEKGDKVVKVKETNNSNFPWEYYPVSI